MSFLAKAPRPRIITTLVRRDLSINRSYRLGLAFDLAFGLLSVLVYFFISRALHGGVGAHLGHAPSYFAFASVGVALTTVVSVASNGLVRRVREEQLTGTLEVLVAQPVTAVEIALGLAGFPFLFAIVRAAIYLIIVNIWLGLGLSHPSWVGFALVLMGAAVLVAGIGIALAAVAVLFKRAEALTGVVAFGLGMLGGAYFPRGAFPGWLHTVAALVPTRFAFDGSRAALFRGTGWKDDVLVLVGVGLVMVAAATWLFGQALNRCLRDGSLARY